MEQYALGPNSQQLVRFNAQAANLIATTTHFADQLSVTDPSFVAVVQQQHQQQQNNTIHNVASNFNFFQQQNLSVMGPPVTSSAPNMSTPNQQQAHSQPHLDHQLGSHQMDQTVGNQHQLDPQQLCVMSADSLTNNIANSGSFIFDQTNNMFRIHPPHSGVLDASSALTFSGLRQQHHQLHQHQNHQQQQQHLTNGHSSTDSEHQNNNNGHRSHNARANRSDENGHKRSSTNVIGHTSGVHYNSNNNGSGRSPTKSSSVTNQATKTNDSGRANSKCSKTKGANSKKIQKPDKNPDPNRRTFSCPTCGKGFTENFNMKRHMQIHSQTRPKFECNECSKTFAWKDNFVRHKKAAHDNVLEPFAI